MALPRPLGPSAEHPTGSDPATSGSDHGSTSGHPTRSAADAPTLVLANAVVLIVGFDHALRPGISATLPLALVLVPVWFRSLRQHSLAPTIIALGVASVGAGVVLSELAAATHRIDQSTRVQSIALLLSGLGALGLLLWARQHLPLHRILVLYGTGSLLSALSAGELSWKFDLSVPTIFVVVGLLERSGRHRGAAIAIVALGTLGLADEGRSLFALCLLTAMLVLLQSVTGTRERRSISRPLVFALLVGFAVAVYALGSALLTGGYLGSTLQERSTAQVEATGSLITGGRPEWSATRQLMSIRPEGFGPGVVPSWSDYMTGRSGLASINVDTGGYARHYLFGGQFRLHSIAADLWVAYGYVGLLFAATIALALLRSLIATLASAMARTSTTFATLLALWYLLFGPIFTNWLDVCAALGFVLMTREDSVRTSLRRAR